MTLPPSVDELERLALKARAAMPRQLRDLAAEVRIRVEDWPPEDTLDDLGIEDAYDLTGLYEGVPLTHKSVMDPAPQPDLVRLFRRPILDEWIARGDIPLDRLVAHVLVHELAHHFGWSDDDIAAIDRWWED